MSSRLLTSILSTVTAIANQRNSLSEATHQPCLRIANGTAVASNQAGLGIDWGWGTINAMLRDRVTRDIRSKQ